MTENICVCCGTSIPEGRQTCHKCENGVNHPLHYNQGKYECIDEMIALFGIDTVKSFCKCNAYKYRYRAGSKDGESKQKDMAKCEWYVAKLMELEKQK